MNSGETLKLARNALEAFLRAPSVGSNGPGSSTLVVQDFNLRATREAIAAIDASLAQPAASDEPDDAHPLYQRGWKAGYKHGAWQARHCAAQPAPTSRLKWMDAPRRSEWGAGMMEALAALGPDETLRLYAHRDAVPMADALLSAQPAPARVPLTDAQAHAMWVNATIERTDMGSVYLRGLRDGEAVHGIAAPDAPQSHPQR